MVSEKEMLKSRGCMIHGKGGYTINVDSLTEEQAKRINDDFNESEQVHMMKIEATNLNPDWDNGGFDDYKLDIAKRLANQDKFSDLKDIAQKYLTRRYGALIPILGMIDKRKSDLEKEVV